MSMVLSIQINRSDILEKTAIRQLPQSQPASAKLQKVFKELTLWSRKV